MTQNCTHDSPPEHTHYLIVEGHPYIFDFDAIGKLPMHTQPKEDSPQLPVNTNNLLSDTLITLAYKYNGENPHQHTHTTKWLSYTLL